MRGCQRPAYFLIRRKRFFALTPLGAYSIVQGYYSSLTDCYSERTSSNGSPLYQGPGFTRCLVSMCL
jgi:hypothetical protein